jgi:hypothetical protein
VTGDENLIGDGNVLAEDGGVAAGRDIRDSQIITGENSGLAANQSDVDDVVVGDDNQVAQDSNAVGFGDGDVSQAYLDDVTVDDGSAVSVGGDAEGSSSDDDVNLTNFGDGDVQANVNTGEGDLKSRQTVDESVNTDDSFNQDNDVDASVNDSGNVDIDDSGNTDASVNDSGNVDIDDSGNTEDNDGLDIL